MDGSAQELAVGLGVCSPSHHLVIRPTPITMELGAFPDLLREAFAALHRANRHSGTSGYAAICLPEAGSGRGIEALGTRIVMIGSAEILAAILADEGLSRLARRYMFTGAVREQDPTGMRQGQVLLRSRHIEKRCAGSGLADRRARRDARRAVHIAATAGTFDPARKPSIPERLTGFVTLGAGRRIGFIARTAPYLGAEIRVTTYGLSPMTSPSVLPWSETCS